MKLWQNRWISASDLSASTDRLVGRVCIRVRGRAWLPLPACAPPGRPGHPNWEAASWQVALARCGRRTLWAAPGGAPLGSKSEPPLPAPIGRVVRAFCGRKERKKEKMAGWVGSGTAAKGNPHAVASTEQGRARQGQKRELVSRLENLLKAQQLEDRQVHALAEAQAAPAHGWRRRSAGQGRGTGCRRLRPQPTNSLPARLPPLFTAKLTCTGLWRLKTARGSPG